LKRSWVWTLLHLLAIVGILGALLCGMRIATLDHDFIMWLSPILPEGEVHQCHQIFGSIFLASSLSLVLYKRAQNTPLSYIGRAGLFILSWIPIIGIVIYSFGDPYGVLLDLHFYGSLLAILFLILHGGGYFIKGGRKTLLKAINAKPAIKKEKLVLLSVVGIFTIMMLILFKEPPHMLYAAQLDKNDTITIDGHADEKAWEKATPVTLHVYGGAHFNHGATTLKIKALKSKKNIYLYIKWKDKTKSLKHLPIIKTASGWKVEEDGFVHFDEKNFYEDKLAVMLSNDCAGPAGHSIHLGPHPLPNHQSNWHGRGYHYTTDGTIRDLWQWKAVRSNPMGIADDDFFGAPAPQWNGIRRYKAGYIADGKDSGGISMNWKWYTPNGIVPKRIRPKSDHNLSEHAIGWYDYDEYSKQKDDMKVGTHMASVLLKANTIEGDQADVQAKGFWKDGWWHLELTRALDTKSPNDLPIKNGICMWVVAFDHTQIRHTRYNRPLKLFGFEE